MHFLTRYALGPCLCDPRRRESRNRHKKRVSPTLSTDDYVPLKEQARNQPLRRPHSNPLRGFDEPQPMWALD
jgi:hypothetical protein